ncbi:MAG: hypothetical protein H6707_03475 [Deltaproteobacteria bacterium]|nr:hypothetical protein [Deltaproteobacteria bacterium]
MAAKQKAFILYMTTWGGDKGEVERETNLDKLNGLLSEGWRVSSATPMSGHGEDDDETRCLVVLDKS